MNTEKIIEVYSDRYGNEPFTKWVESIVDSRSMAVIDQRLLRVKQGNLGDHKSVGDGVFELRIHRSPGYRIYYGHNKEKFIILLFGGDKSSQKRDIELAKKYWCDYMERNK